MVKSVSSSPSSSAERVASTRATETSSRARAPRPQLDPGDAPPTRRRKLDGTDAPGSSRRTSLPVAAERTSSAPLPPAVAVVGVPSAAHPRRVIQAKDVDQILSLRLQGLVPKEIAAHVSLPLASVQKWLAPGRWTAENLAGRIAKQADYSGFRERIQTHVQALGLHQGELPLPTGTGLPPLQAETFAIALEMVIARPTRSPVSGRFLEHVAQTLNISYPQLRGWISADGKLTKPLDSVRNLAGFDEQAVRIADAFKSLKQPDLAQHIVLGGGQHQRSLTAGVLVAALQARANRPDRPLRQIAMELQLEPNLLSNMINSRGQVQVPADRIALLPGYDDHRRALSRSLKALGQIELALELPPVAMDAAQFLQSCRQHAEALMHAVDRLASENARPATAVQGTELSPKVMQVLFDKQGALRPEADVHRRLRGLENYQHLSVATLLGDIAARRAGMVRPMDRASMKRIDMGRAGNAPEKVLIVHPESADPGANAPRRLERIYAHSADLVRAPRSYEADRPRQVLRWLSTVLKQRFPNSLEVQCYYDEATRKIVVAPNHNTANKPIRDFLASGELLRLLRSPAVLSASASAPRDIRHHAKLDSRMDPAHPALGLDAAQAIFAAIAEGRFEVPRRNRVDNDPTRGLHMHAERRIKEYVQERGGPPPDPAMLAGTMRPCGTCATELQLPAQAHRGPYWRSQSAGVGIDTDELIERDRRNGVGTSVTRNRAGTLSFDIDTESDSDHESVR